MLLKFFTNKHVIAAFLVTPILAVLGYVLADQWVKEKPHVAQKGQSYPLIAKSNCRYTSGRCTLNNNEFNAFVSVVDGAHGPTLQVHAETSLEGVLAAVGDHSPKKVKPQPLNFDAESNVWTLSLAAQPTSAHVLRLAIQAHGVNYYAETPMTFSTYETSFDRSTIND